MIVKIDKLSHDFKGITKVNNKVTFVSDVIPNEVVDIKITDEKKNINFGKVISYIETSEDRINNICPYYDKCGGCNTSFIKYEKSLLYKKNIVIDIMKRYANIDINPDIVFGKYIYNYRNKISFKVLNNHLALNKEESNELVNVDDCLLVNDNINDIIALFNDIDLNGAREVIIRGTDEIMVIINGTINSNNIIHVLKDKVSSIIINDKIVYGSEYITINVDKYKYAIYPNSFFQVNTDMIELLYDKVKEYAGTGESLLDLYCGAGTIGIYLADNFDKVKGIEVNSDAVMSANVNKKINNISNISFECKKANQINNIKDDVVVVDPPRSGLDKITINKLNDSSCNRLVYVSCNPITLARDINLLKDKYELKNITLFDMFPNTKHVECVSVLCRKDSE